MSSNKPGEKQVDTRKTKQGTTAKRQWSALLIWSAISVHSRLCCGTGSTLNHELYRDTDRRRTVNGPTMYDHIEKNNAGVIRALQEAISQPGPHIGQAFNRFTASVAAGSKINKCSISSLLLEAFCRSECESVAEDARGIVIDAVSRSRDLDAMLQEVVETGMTGRQVLMMRSGWQNWLDFRTSTQRQLQDRKDG